MEENLERKRTELIDLAIRVHSIGELMTKVSFDEFVNSVPEELRLDFGYLIVEAADDILKITGTQEENDEGVPEPGEGEEA